MISRSLIGPICNSTALLAGESCGITFIIARMRHAPFVIARIALGESFAKPRRRFRSDHSAFSMSQADRGVNYLTVRSTQVYRI